MSKDRSFPILGAENEDRSFPSLGAEKEKDL